MKNIFIIIKKEITDLLRDRRTLLTMILIPLLLFPIIINISVKISSNQAKKETEKPLTVGIIDHNNAAQLIQIIQGMKDVRLVKENSVADFDTLIKKGELDGALLIDESFNNKVDSMGTGEITLFYKSANWGVKDRLMSIIDAYKNDLAQQRLARLNIDKSAINPVKVNIQDITSMRERFGKEAGGFIPYIFVIFGFIGCMYPAIDLFTNEKERGTLETILVAPVSRLEILFGKMIVVSLIGFMSAIVSIIGLAIGLKQATSTLPGDVISAITSFIDPANVIMMLVMLLPLIVFFSGLLTLITTYAKTYKEAQSMVSPLTIVVIVPAVIGLMPGIDYNYMTAIIPITNISLASKEIVAGTISIPLYTLTLVSLLVYASISVLLAKIWFSKESNIIKA